MCGHDDGYDASTKAGTAVAHPTTCSRSTHKCTYYHDLHWFSVCTDGGEGKKYTK